MVAPRALGAPQAAREPSVGADSQANSKLVRSWPSTRSSLHPASAHLDLLTLHHLC
jgi:hypothetical protein